MNQTETRKIRVYGIVQGVGFRPTVSRHAVKNDISRKRLQQRALCGDFCTGKTSTGGWLP